MVERIEGMKHVYAMQEGEDWRLTPSGPIIVHPDRAPKIIRDGEVIELLPCPTNELREAMELNQRRIYAAFSGRA